MSPLLLALRADIDRSVTVHLKGLLDAVTGPQTRARLVAHVASGVERVVVDLAAVEEMDAAGLSALVMARRELRRHGIDMELVGAHAPSVRRTLAVTRFAPMFDLSEPFTS